MRRFRQGSHSRTGHRTPAGRARDARREFIDVLRTVRGKAVRPEQIRDSPLSVLSTAEFARNYGTRSSTGHRNLLERSPATCDAVEACVLAELGKGSRPTEILGSLRGIAHKFSLPL